MHVRAIGDVLFQCLLYDGRYIYTYMYIYIYIYYYYIYISVSLIDSLLELAYLKCWSYDDRMMHVRAIGDVVFQCLIYAGRCI
jgi:hypothetical protein